MYELVLNVCIVRILGIFSSKAGMYYAYERMHIKSMNKRGEYESTRVCIALRDNLKCVRYRNNVCISFFTPSYMHLQQTPEGPEQPQHLYQLKLPHLHLVRHRRPAPA